MEPSRPSRPGPPPVGGRPTMAEGLELHESEDGLVVYQEATDRVHHLNPTAAVILLLCDGDHDPAAIAAVVAETFATPEVPLAETEACLARLAAERLVR